MLIVCGRDVQTMHNQYYAGLLEDIYISFYA